MKRIPGKRGWPITCQLAMLASLFLSQNCHAGTTRKGVDRTQLIKAVVQRLAKLQNLVVHYQDEVYLPKISLPPMRVVKQYHLQPRYGHRFYNCEFRFLHGRAFYERSLMPASLAAVGTPGGPSPIGDIKDVASFMASRTETLTYGYHTPNRPVGAIMDSGERRLPYSTIDISLGLRLPGEERWMSPSGVRRLVVGQPDGSDFTMWKQAKDGDILRWNWHWDDGRLELRQIEVIGPHKGVVYDRRLCSGFHAVGGLLLPGRVEQTDWEPVGKHAIMHHAVLTHIQYRIGAKSNTAKSYYIVFPKGAGVLDERINQQFNVESGPRRLTDKAIFKLQKHYDRLPDQAIPPDANAVKPLRNPPALPIASSAVPAAGASGSGVPRWLLEVIAALATGGLAVVVWLVIRKLGRERRM